MQVLKVQVVPLLQSGKVTQNNTNIHVIHITLSSGPQMNFIGFGGPVRYRNIVYKQV